MNTFVIDKESLKKAWGADGQYWFDLTDYSIIEDYNFIGYEIPDDASEEEIIDFKGVIPYFNIKRYELAKAFVQTLKNAKVKSKLESIPDDAIIEYFWKYFHVYPEDFKEMENFQHEYILSGLKNWCEENNINYEEKL